MERFVDVSMAAMSWSIAVMCLVFSAIGIYITLFGNKPVFGG